MIVMMNLEEVYRFDLYSEFLLICQPESYGVQLTGVVNMTTADAQCLSNHLSIIPILFYFFPISLRGHTFKTSRRCVTDIQGYLWNAYKRHCVVRMSVDMTASVNIEHIHVNE
jgi:hypothetical protein